MDILDSIYNILKSLFKNLVNCRFLIFEFTYTHEVMNLNMAIFPMMQQHAF